MPLLSLLGLTAVLFARRPGMFLHPQFWAEDGSIFFVQADVDGMRALFLPNSGYHHLLLRLIAAAVAPCDAAVVPAAYFWVSVGVILLLAAAIFSPRINLSCRPACVLAIGLLPHSGEVLVNLTNLQWLAALGLVWLLLARDATSPRQLVCDPLFAGVLGLTGVFSVLLAPLFLLRSVRRHTGASWTLTGVITAAAAIQVCTVARSGTGAVQTGAWSVGHVLQTVGLRVGDGLLLPADFADHLPAGVHVVAGACCLTALVLAAFWPGTCRPERQYLAASAAFIVGGTLFRMRADLGQLDGIAMGDRYFFLPKLLILWILIQGCSTSGWHRWICCTACAAALGASVAHWRFEELPRLDWNDYARRIQAGEDVPKIPINPGGTFHHPGRHKAFGLFPSLSGH